MIVGLLLVAGCSHRSSETVASPIAVALPRPAMGADEPLWDLPIGAYAAERERCIDRELASRNLNEFGDVVGTTYAPGSPELALTNRSDRYRYVLHRRRDIAATCTRAPRQPAL